MKEQDCAPLLGEKFPTVEVETTLGKKMLPGDYAGKWFVLFSHPGDFTPVCTTEFVEFQRRSEEFTALNTELIGLSLDDVFAHMKWIEWIRDNFNVLITFPIIADQLGKVALRLGMISPELGSSTVRTVYIIDPQGTIQLMMNYPPVVGRNIEEILRVVRALQVAAEFKVATPVDWPQNAYLGDKVIIPPPRNVMAVEKRLEEAKQGDIQCLDWWFCYKSLEK
ncbi:peroxiredoxin [Paenisporosarcina antarctica]|uniref:Peroxiredoxin n=1 Tax=Paenisporosarcina antarctica TaxID=417367 RepID=A0A4P6ZXU8_9BACL|nr:peroxiredoxin [Paenisporosarcina antarctica]QBP41257.1 peroxiredoxin [Paenisporosarcina antarctica]